MLLSIALLSYILSRLSTSDVHYTRDLSQKAAFFGDTVFVRCRVENRKPLPVWLRLDDDLPAGWVTGPDLILQAGRPRAVRRTEVALGAYETSIKDYPLDCSSRGVFTLGPASLQSRDPFGLYPVTKALGSRQTLVVYPRIVPVDDAPCKDLHPFGTKRRESWVYQDPVELKTSRDYSPGDAARFIDHKASARTGNLKTRVFDATFARRVVICLNLSTARAPWEGADIEVFESLVTAASSVAWSLSRKGQSVGLCTNGISRPEEGFSFLAQCPPASGSENLRQILTCLSGLGYYVFDAFSKACRVSWLRSSPTHPLIITSVLDDEVISLLQSRDSRDGTVLLLDRSTANAPTQDPALDEVAGLCQGRVFVAELEGGWQHAERLRIDPLAR